MTTDIRTYVLEQIGKGNYKPHPLWAYLTKADERDGYGLKMLFFDGPGEYQRIEIEGDSYLIKSTIFDEARSKCPDCGNKLKIDPYPRTKFTHGECEKCKKKFISEYDNPFK